jgi:heat shock protein beta
MALTQTARLLPLTLLLAWIFVVLLNAPRGVSSADAKVGEDGEGHIEADLKAEKVPLKTDDDVAQREERSIAPSPGYTQDELKLLEQTKESFDFQSDVSRIMHIIINNVYSNREVFLRELISNASDALDKIRLQSLTDSAKLGDRPELEIRIRADPEHGTLTITDTGVGMTKEELIKNLGTVAHSGTKHFSELLGKDSSNLIGQFGVGFYSAFLVADHVTVVSKSNDDPDQWIWESTADSSFSVVKDPRGNTLGRGTSITLHIKADADSQTYLDQARLREVIVRYSDFISFPIYLWESHTEQVPEEKTEEEDEAEEVSVKDDEDEDEYVEKPEAPKTVVVWDWVRINNKQPIWTRRKDDITDEEYTNFYQSIAKTTAPPLAHVHFSAEGENGAFKAIVFLPEEPPYSQFNPSVRQKGVRLFVRRVFITDDLDILLPKYLSFLQGVVDSDDLPLNLSRETLQQHKALELIRNKLVRKTIAMFQQLGDAETEEEKAKYEKFWKSYSTNIKLGIIEDTSNRPRLAKLLRYLSSTTGLPTSLDDYIARMKEGQEDIYFLAGENVESLKTSPLLEKLTDKGYEVLFAVDPIDEYTMQQLPKYENHKLVNLAKEGVKLPDEDTEDKDHEEDFKDLLSFLKKSSNKISRVKISQRLSRSPCALVAETWGYSAQMEKVIKAQALTSSDDPQSRMWIGKKVLEINPDHPIINALNRMVKADDKDPKAKEVAALLIDTAALSSGYGLEQPSTFVSQIHNLISSTIGINPEERNNKEHDSEGNDDHEEL